MSAIYKNGIAYGGAASAANLISATDASGGASNVQAQLNSLNDNLTNKLDAGSFFIDDPEKRRLNSNKLLNNQILFAADDKLYIGNQQIHCNILTTSGSTDISALTYPQGTVTEVVQAFGWITSAAVQCHLYCFCGKNFWAHWTTSVSKVEQCWLRTISGNYVGNSGGSNLTSYIKSSSVVSRGTNMIQLILENANGWGITNNTPVAGTLTITHQVY